MQIVRIPRPVNASLVNAAYAMEMITPDVDRARRSAWSQRVKQRVFYVVTTRTVLIRLGRSARLVFANHVIQPIIWGVDQTHRFAMTGRMGPNVCLALMMEIVGSPVLVNV